MVLCNLYPDRPSALLSAAKGGYLEDLQVEGTAVTHEKKSLVSVGVKFERIMRVVKEEGSRSSENTAVST